MKLDLGPVFKKTGEVIIDNLPTLAARGAVVGVIGSVVLMHKADNKVHYILSKEPKRKKKSIKQRLSLTWKCYIPVVTSTGVTIGLILISDKMWRNKYLALAGAYELTRKAYDEYREETKRQIGEEKEKDIHEKATEKTVSDIKNGITFDERFITRCGWGNTMFIESTTGQIIIGNRESIKEVYNKLNHRMNTTCGDPCLSLDELCDELGLRHISGGDSRGWDRNISGLIEPKFIKTTQINGDPDLPATIIEYYQDALDNFGRERY